MDATHVEGRSTEVVAGPMTLGGRRPSARRRSSPRWRGLVLSVVLLAGIAACSDGDPGESTDDAGGIDLDLDAAPDPAAILSEERGDPPTELGAEDLVVGDGDQATQGAQLTVQYVGVRWSDGGQFDSSWESGQPFRFTLGDGQVIPGWERGIAGEGVDVDAMRVGGRRSLVIPPDLAYGDRGAASVIGPDETLVFVIDLLDVQPAP